MFEFHGWAVIRESFDEANEDEDVLKAIVAELSEQIRAHPWVNGPCRLEVVNGAYHLWTTGVFNHRGDRGEELLELFRWIARMAPGSYGLLYVYDDEAENLPERVGFQVWRLARGQLLRHQDPFLSPYFPVVEDPS